MTNIIIGDQTPLNGTLVKQVGYDHNEKVLEVEFQPPQEGNTATEKHWYMSFPEFEFNNFIETVGLDPDMFYHTRVRGLYPQTRPF